jgi:hypothetical protein
LYQIDAQNWSSVVLNSLVKFSKNEVITFERLKISLKSFMGPVCGLRLKAREITSVSE